MMTPIELRRYCQYLAPSTNSERGPRARPGLQECANGWGGSSPEVDVANLYTNSVQLSADECLATTFQNPESKYFTSVTAYDKHRYLIEGVRHLSSYTWKTNDDGTITVRFNCGDDAANDIDTKGQPFSFTMRYYGVRQRVVDGKIAPETSVEQ